MKISKQEKEVMELLEKRQLKIGAYRGFISNVSFNKVASSIHKIYKPLLEDLKAENDRLLMPKCTECNGAGTVRSGYYGTVADNTCRKCDGTGIDPK